MALFALICIDKPNALALRTATRPAHLAFIETRKGMIRLSGPFLDEAGNMNGSLLILEAPDAEAVRAFSDADPYAQAGLFERVEIRAWKPVAGPLS